MQCYPGSSTEFFKLCNGRWAALVGDCLTTKTIKVKRYEEYSLRWAQFWHDSISTLVCHWRLTKGAAQVSSVESHEKRWLCLSCQSYAHSCKYVRPHSRYLKIIGSTYRARILNFPVVLTSPWGVFWARRPNSFARHYLSRRFVLLLAFWKLRAIDFHLETDVIIRLAGSFKLRPCFSAKLHPILWLTIKLCAFVVSNLPGRVGVTSHDIDEVP